MWFKLKLNAFCPSSVFLVGKDGYLYVVVEIGILLRKRNPTLTGPVSQHFAVREKDVCHWKDTMFLTRPCMCSSRDPRPGLPITFWTKTCNWPV
ncbi:hypothetical protein AVEN_65468-1 [Araneus ventricosus]|uniref:Uncharacterized protein n=1 Tax=Araneus ventricosus TaxID=182803 RepID=A0A4Y2NPI5_ARAVE|nr:hypothetical protein AVEN_65468-1 [Araneus ventricosus]